jgi:hypothetical protein
MILSSPLEVDYIHEPFNPQCGLPGVTGRFRHVRPSLDTEEMQRYHALSTAIFSYDFSLRSGMYEKDPWHKKLAKKIIGGRGPFYLRLAKLNPFHNAAVIKDPTGCLLTEYLYLHFKVKPVIVIKHPLSLVASIQRANWTLLSNSLRFGDQPYLIEDYFSDDNGFIARDWPNPVLEAAAFWRAIYKVLLVQAGKYPDWQLITHEQLSQDPVPIFRQLYSRLELPWREPTRRKILRLTQGNRSADSRRKVGQDFRRSSANIFEVRRNSFSIKERKAIFEIVEDVASQIYTRESFAID